MIPEDVEVSLYSLTVPCSFLNHAINKMPPFVFA